MPHSFWDMTIITVNKQDRVWEDWQRPSGLHTAFLHCEPLGHILWEMFFQRKWSSSFSQSFSQWQMAEDWVAEGGKNNFQYVYHLQKCHKKKSFGLIVIFVARTDEDYGKCSFSRAWPRILYHRTCVCLMMLFTIIQQQGIILDFFCLLIYFCLSL